MHACIDTYVHTRAGPVLEPERVMPPLPHQPQQLRALPLKVRPARPERLLHGLVRPQLAVHKGVEGGDPVAAPLPLPTDTAQQRRRALVHGRLPAPAPALRPRLLAPYIPTARHEVVGEPVPPKRQAVLRLHPAPNLLRVAPHLDQEQHIGRLPAAPRVVRPVHGVLRLAGTRHAARQFEFDSPVRPGQARQEAAAARGVVGVQGVACCRRAPEPPTLLLLLLRLGLGEVCAEAPGRDEEGPGAGGEQEELERRERHHTDPAAPASSSACHGHRCRPPPHLCEEWWCESH